MMAKDRDEENVQCSDTRFAPLADFLEPVPTHWPHELFSREGDTKSRASQAEATFADAAHAITAIEARWGISLAAKVPRGERAITGHIDFLQVRNGAAHLLDYKPDATTNKPFAQLTIYALALSHLTGIPLFDFKCAWFNEHQYCEFFSRTILARNAPTQLKERAA